MDIEKVIQTPANMQLTDCNWGWFKYDDIFTIERGQCTGKSSDNGYYLIGASKNFNGSNKVITFTYPFYKKAKITVGNSGNTGCGQAFFQPFPFNAKSTVNIVDIHTKYSITLNQYIGMFIITIIRLEQYKYNFGRSWSIERMKKSTIKLPITTQGDPDWQFMEDYIKQFKMELKVWTLKK